MPSAPRTAASVLATWPATIVRALEARGLDAGPLLDRAGIVSAGLGPGARVPRAALNRLWAAAVDATGDPAFGLEAARFTAQTTFHALGYAVLASATLAEAFGRVIRYRRLIGDVLELRLVEAADRCALEVDVSADPSVPFQAVDAIAAVSVRQARLLLGRRGFAPLAVRFARSEPADPEPYRRCFRCPILWRAHADAVEFARADMERPLPAGNAELARSNDEVVLRYLARLDDARVSARVRQALLEALPNGAPAKAAVARALGMSARNLQRRLAGEGTSFSALLEDARVDLARGYVADARLSISEIAFLLGFADTSTFSRAFRRWTGVSPRAWAARR